MTRSVYVGPKWPAGGPEPEECCHFRCANDDCPSHYEDRPCTRKYKVPGGFICELCAEAHDSEVADEGAAAIPTTNRAIPA